MSTHKKQDDCTKDCDLINQIFAGEARESWHCRTHQRPYYPNKPHKKQDEETLREKIAELIEQTAYNLKTSPDEMFARGVKANAVNVIMSLITERDKKRDAYIIGEDEKHDVGYGRIFDRNRLRAEQRKRSEEVR